MRRYAAAIATLWLGLTVLLVPPARAEGEPAAAPAAERSVRIGPQALVIADEHGNVFMAEEPSPREDDITILNALFAATTGALVVPVAVLPPLVVTGANYVEVVELDFD